MKISRKGIDLIKKFEGCYLKAYKCPAGIPTIGFGHTKGVNMGMIITKEQAEQLLKEDLVVYEQGVDRLVKVKLTQNEFDALVSFAFNLGVGALEKSTLLRKLNAGDKYGASLEFPRWVRAGGKVLKGLIRRREAERALFIGEDK